MAFRKLTTDEFTKVMSTNQMAIAMNKNVSHIVTPMRNTDIKRAEKTGDWSELMEKAYASTRRFRNEFYS